MSFLDWLLGRDEPAARPASSFRHAPPPGGAAVGIMRSLNANALVAREGGRCVFVEDHADADGRLFRIEYQCAPDGSGATAWCRHKPWPGNNYGIHQCHLWESGQICLGDRQYGLRDAVMRARYWCSAYSYLREHGNWPG